MKIQPRFTFRALSSVCGVLLCCVVFCFVVVPNFATAAPVPDGQGLKPILDYISSGWDTLTRSMTACESIVDPKIAATSVLYLPAGFAEPAAVKSLSGKCNVRVEHLPIEIHHLGEINTSKFNPPGLLYLPEKYVVPGGRFNEMYGWDSYFIIRGLLRQAGRVGAWHGRQLLL